MFINTTADHPLHHILLPVRIQYSVYPHSSVNTTLYKPVVVECRDLALRLRSVDASTAEAAHSNTPAWPYAAFPSTMCQRRYFCSAQLRCDGLLCVERRTTEVVSLSVLERVVSVTSIETEDVCEHLDFDMSLAPTPLNLSGVPNSFTMFCDGTLVKGGTVSCSRLSIERLGGHGASCPSLVLVGWMANVRSPMLNNALPLTFPCLVRGNCSRRCPPHMRSGATVPSSRRPQCAPRCTFNGAPMPVGTASSTPWVCSPPLFRRCLAFVPSHSSLM